MWRKATWLLGGLVGAVVGLLGVGAALADPSALWGESGELFDPAGRIMDWSYAGYHYGEDPLPDLSPTVSITDHGAIADDGIDDTAAFLAAIAAVSGGGVVGVPAGVFILQDKIQLPSGVVLQGAGPDQTTIDVPVSLTDLLGNAGLDASDTSTYSFSQAFIEIRGSDGGDVLTTVTTNAARGAQSLQLASTDGLEVGQWIRIVQTDVGGELMNRLYSDLMDAGPDLYGDVGMDFHTRIAAVTASGIEIERALPLDVDTGWSPEIRAFEPRTSEVGIEHLTIQFPVTTYPGHFAEQGYNAIDFSGVANSWVRNVHILNADYGVNVRSSFFMTIQDVVLDTTGDRGAIVGHHGLNNGHGGDNLFIGFDIRTTFQHDLTNEWYATGVVFTKGRGDNLRMDHHCAAPYLTLWTEIDAGAGTTPFVSGGSADRCPHTASYDTLWNVTASSDMALPPDDYGPRMNFIGFQTSATSVTSPYDWWFEDFPPDQPNLWEAQREARLGAMASGGAGGAASTGGSPAGGATSTGGSPAGGGAQAGGSGGSSGTVVAGTSGAISVGAPGTSAAAPSGDESSCGCRSAGRGGSGAWGWLLAAALLMCSRRARRHVP